MNDFERMMSMEGVRPLGQGREHPRRSPDRGPLREPSNDLVLNREPKPIEYAWATGSRARTALETALERLANEVRLGRRGWATGLRQDGTTITLPASSGAAALLGAADRQSLRLMIVGGDGWTFVMHPLVGVATLDEDPADPEYPSVWVQSLQSKSRQAVTDLRLHQARSQH